MKVVRVRGEGESREGVIGKVGRRGKDGEGLIKVGER